MEEAKRLHLIPILRIASFPVDDHWMAPNEYDLVDFANFLEELPWPVKNRYIIVYNEPNHDSEWGGFVYPEEYAKVLDRAIEIFHQENPDYFVISAGMDASAPSSDTSLDEYSYFRLMNAAVPGIFKKVDGFSSHAYGNPAFTSSPNIYSPVSVASYRFEERYLEKLGADKLPVFITEAGWKINLIGDQYSNKFYLQSFNNIWNDSNIVAITPFILNAQEGAFRDFSFLDNSGNWKTFAREIMNISKVKGQPLQDKTPTRSYNLGPGNKSSAARANTDLPILSLFSLLESMLRTFLPN